MQSSMLKYFKKKSDELTTGTLKCVYTILKLVVNSLASTILRSKLGLVGLRGWHLVGGQKLVVRRG